MKFWLGLLAGAAGILLIAALAVLLFLMIPKGHAAPFVTDEPGDQKKNMGMYDDAEGPPWTGIPIVGSMDMGGWALCMKPGVQIAEDEHGNGIYATDDEVIWRCIQTHPTGEPISVEKAPVVYCFIQNHELTGQARRMWACYHNYGHVWAHYQHQYEKNPLILPDALPFIPEVKYVPEPAKVIPGDRPRPATPTGRVWSASRTVDSGVGWHRS